MDVRLACGRLGGDYSSSDVREPKAFPQRKVMQTYLDDTQLHYMTQLDAVFAGKDSFTHLPVYTKGCYLHQLNQSPFVQGWRFTTIGLPRL